MGDADGSADAAGKMDSLTEGMDSGEMDEAARSDAGAAEGRNSGAAVVGTSVANGGGINGWPDLSDS